MKYQNTFKRYEIKYILTTSQKEAVLAAMNPYMRLDKYGRTTIRNIYFDSVYLSFAMMIYNTSCW